MASKKTLMKALGRVLFLSVTTTVLVTNVSLQKEVKLLQESPSTDLIDQLQERVEALEQVVEALRQEVSMIPIDEALQAEQLVYAWIEVFFRNQADQIDVNELDKVMYIPGEDPEFYRPDHLEKTAIMFTTVFYRDQGITLEVLNKESKSYRVTTLEGNSFDLRIREGSKISSPWSMAYKADQYFQSFLKDLKASNKEALYHYITYEAYDWTPEDFEAAFDKHLGKVATFNSGSIGYVFSGISQDGFRFEVYDRQTQEKAYFDVNTSNGILTMKNSEYLWGE